MRKLFLVVAFVAVPTMAAASGADGVWSSEKDKHGGYLEITIAPCESDAKLTCGVISRAFGKSGEDPNYANLGKKIIEGMKDHGDGTYSGGTIWDPVHDKVFKSKMTLKGDELDVDGCVSFFCEGQHWQRVAR